jgi:hypothetical protein
MAKLQAKQDAIAAKEQQKQAKGAKTPEAIAQSQAVDAPREGTSEQDRQQALDAAAERLRAAEEEYQAELARRSQR